MSQPITLTQLLIESARSHPERTAMRHKILGLWESVTWADYLQAAREIACGLISLGMEPGDRVGLISENRPEWLFGDQGIIAAGGVTVGIYTTSSSAQVEYILNHSDARFHIVEDEEQLDKVLLIRERTPNLKKVIVIDPKGLRDLKEEWVITLEDLRGIGREYDRANPQAFDEATQRIGEEDLALLVYTSGTTGPPKGTMLSHKNAVFMSTSLGQRVEVKKGDQLMSFLPLCHVAERLVSVFNQLRFGYTLNFAESMETVPQNLQEIRPHFFFAVPRIWEKFYSTIMLRMDDADFLKKALFRLATAHGLAFVRDQRAGKSVAHRRPVRLLFHLLVYRKLKKHIGMDRARVAISGAAPISPELIDFYQSIGIPLSEGYGQTECAGVATMHDGASPMPGTVGRTTPGVEVKIDEGTGEILIKSDGVCLGYYKNEEATAETIRDGWLHSGDVGEFTPEGYLRITDRMKDLIITAGGKNISPQYIENKIRISPYIHDAIVIGDRRKFLSALIIIDEDNVVAWAGENRLAFSTFSDLSSKPEVRALVDAEIQKVNKSLSNVEAIKKFSILVKRLDTEDDELTPTLKVKRKMIGEKFKDQIESMYR